MGTIEIIDILCTVATMQSELIKDMYIQLEQAGIADEVMKSLKDRKKKCSDVMETADCRIRRNRTNG